MSFNEGDTAVYNSITYCILWVFFGALPLAPRHTKEVAYKTLVRPQLEYAAPIWHPYNETQTAKEDCCPVDLQEMEEHQ